MPTPKRDHHDARREARKRDQAEACARLDFMHTYPGAGHDPDDHTRARADGVARRLGMRPLKPPPGPANAPPRLTAGARAAAKDRRMGLLDDGRGRFLDDAEEM